MQSNATTVEQYLQEIPADRQLNFNQLNEVCTQSTAS